MLLEELKAFWAPELAEAKAIVMALRSREEVSSMVYMTLF